MVKITECESCGSRVPLTRDEDTDQMLCDDCINGVDTSYCGVCNSVVHNDSLEWLNDCPLCVCGAKIEL